MEAFNMIHRKVYAEDEEREYVSAYAPRYVGHLPPEGHPIDDLWEPEQCS